MNLTTKNKKKAIIKHLYNEALSKIGKLYFVSVCDDLGIRDMEK